ncbi:claudin-3-like [Indicator indicator]|uniref:claudin-3-like n=1 Tax=Indicator indicator TaxID=1002788 RepID=UPI0023DE713A|nr:claudin-3-like [Indicator indicator]
MANSTQQLSGLLLSLLGWIGSIITCALPTWRVSAFLGTDMMAAQTVTEGLFQTCVSDNAGRLQCKYYDSLLEISPGLQAGRGLVITSIFTAFFGLVAVLTGFRSSRFAEDENIKNRNTVIGGVTFVMAGVMLLIPVASSANSTVCNFYNPLVPESLKRELGSAIIVGLFSFALELIGGSVLCSAGLSTNRDSDRERKGCSYPMKDYV